MKRSRIKILSAMLTAILLLSNLFSACINSNASAPVEINVESVQERQNKSELTLFASNNDPLEYMQDIPVELRNMPDTESLDDEMRRELEMNEPEPDDGSTDRYIIKYKPGQKQAFERKLSAEIASSEAISVAVDRASSDTRTRGRTGEKSVLPESDWEVLTLNEKVLPSEFAAAIRISNALSDIEYIQPDYKLSLDSFDEEEPTEEESAEPVEEEMTELFEEEATEEEIPESSENERETEEEPEELFDEEEPFDEEIEAEKRIVNGEIIAVIDTGMDIYHKDLANYVDTANMWNFTENTNEVYSSANPYEYAHGTHIAGIIANTARENGVDNIKILPLRVFNNGVAYTSDIMAAIEYAVANGAMIINCSFGSTQENPALEEVIANADALFVCAVGNNRRDLTETPSYPACYPLPNVVSVASVNADDGFSYFSNYGEIVDLTALGRDVLSTLPENNYGTMTGTSMSAAYVTAVAAIVSTNEDLTVTELRYRMRTTADRLSNLQNKVDRGRRVSLENAVNNYVQTAIIQNGPEDDFDVHGYQPSEDDESYELYVVQTASQNISNNEEFIMICSLENITTFNDIYTIMYNPTQVTLVDFAAQTPALLDVAVGEVPDTDLEILSHDTLTGELTFKVNKEIPSGEMWSGAVTILKFKAKVSGTTNISLIITDAPKKMTNFEAVDDNSAGKITFTWIDPNGIDTMADYYEIYAQIPGVGWSDTTLGLWITIPASSVNVVNGVITVTYTYGQLAGMGLLPSGGSYDFRIRAFNSAGNSSYVYIGANSGGRYKVDIIIPGSVKPNKVTDFEVDVDNIAGELTFTWIDPNTASSAVAYYEIYTSIPSLGWSDQFSPPVAISIPISSVNVANGVTTFTYTHIQLAALGLLPASGSYDFRMRAFNSVGNSSYAYAFDDTPQGRHKVAITVPGSVKPSAITNFEAVVDNNAQTVTLTWINPNTIGSMVDYYEIYVQIPGIGWSDTALGLCITVPATSVSVVNGLMTVTYTYTHLAGLGLLPNSGSYDFRMRAFNSIGNSSYVYIGADSGGRYKVTIQA